MAAVSHPESRGRGAVLLLAHCAALANPEPIPARARLEELVGLDLARLLLFALTR